MTRCAPLPEKQHLSQSSRRSLTDATGTSAHNKRYRSTTSMTPEQLARKRANDRNAQGAIRARRQAQVSQLEAELEALKNKPHACCRKLLQRNLELECELAMMKGSPLTCPPTTPTGHARGVDEGTRTAESPEMHSVIGQSYSNSEDLARTLLISPAGGCDSSSKTTSPVAMIHPMAGPENRDAPLQGQIAAVYIAESAAMAKQAFVSCGQIYPTISSPSMPDLWATGTHYGNAGGIMDRLATLGVQNIVPTASKIPSPFPQ